MASLNPKVVARFESLSGHTAHESKDYGTFAEVITKCGRIYNFEYAGARVKRKSIRRDFDSERASALYLRDVVAAASGGQTSGVFQAA